MSDQRLPPSTAPADIALTLDEDRESLGEATPQPPSSPQPSIEDDSNATGLPSSDTLPLDPDRQISDVTASGGGSEEAEEGGASEAVPGTTSIHVATPVPSDHVVSAQEEDEWIGGGEGEGDGGAGRTARSVGGDGGETASLPASPEANQRPASTPLGPHPHSFLGPQTRPLAVKQAGGSQPPPLSLNQLAVLSASQHKLPTSRVPEIVARLGRHTNSSAGKMGRWYKGDNYVDNASYSWRNMALFADYQRNMYTPCGTVKATCKK